MKKIFLLLTAILTSSAFSLTIWCDNGAYPHGHKNKSIDKFEIDAFIFRGEPRSVISSMLLDVKSREVISQSKGSITNIEINDLDLGVQLVFSNLNGGKTKYNIIEKDGILMREFKVSTRLGASNPPLKLTTVTQFECTENEADIFDLFSRTVERSVH